MWSWQESSCSPPMGRPDSASCRLLAGAHHRLCAPAVPQVPSWSSRRPMPVVPVYWAVFLHAGMVARPLPGGWKQSPPGQVIACQVLAFMPIRCSCVLYRKKGVRVFLMACSYFAISTTCVYIRPKLMKTWWQSEKFSFDVQKVIMFRLDSVLPPISERIFTRTSWVP